MVEARCPKNTSRPESLKRQRMHAAADLISALDGVGKFLRADAYMDSTVFKCACLGLEPIRDRLTKVDDVVFQ